MTSKPNRPCARAECPGEVTTRDKRRDHRYCCAVCAAIGSAIARAEHRNVPPEEWANLVAVSDAVSDWRSSVLRRAGH